MFVALAINAGQQLCGNGMLASYSTLIYQRTFSDTDTIFLINAIYGMLSILFTLSCTLLIERLGRRKILLIGAAGQGVSLLIISIIGAATPENPDKTRPYGVGIATASLFHVFAVFYKPSWGATVWVYTSEIFSTDVRAHAVAMASQTQSVVSTILNQFFPLFLAKCGFYTFFFFAGLNIFLFLGTWL
jgi:MFS family permease